MDECRAGPGPSQQFSPGLSLPPLPPLPRLSAAWPERGRETLTCVHAQRHERGAPQSPRRHTHTHTCVHSHKHAHTHTHAYTHICMGPRWQAESRAGRACGLRSRLYPWPGPAGCHSPHSLLSPLLGEAAEPGCGGAPSRTSSLRSSAWLPRPSPSCSWGLAVPTPAVGERSAQGHMAS